MTAPAVTEPLFGLSGLAAAFIGGGGFAFVLGLLNVRVQAKRNARQSDTEGSQAAITGLNDLVTRAREEIDRLSQTLTRERAEHAAQMAASQAREQQLQTQHDALLRRFNTTLDRAERAEAALAALRPPTP